nr:phosphotransferase [Amycolatopsis xylanica]
MGRAARRLAPPAHWPSDLRGRCAEAFARIDRKLSDLPSVRGSSSPVLLHGGLHLGNALDGGPGRGLTAIDPKACVGDPCFDAVDYVVTGAGHEGVSARATRVAEACGLDGDLGAGWSRRWWPSRSSHLLQCRAGDR